MFNPFTLRVPQESIVCYFHTFENNLEIKQILTKYLKESCWLYSDKHFSFKYFWWKCFCEVNINKIVRPILAALSANGLMLSNPLMLKSCSRNCCLRNCCLEFKDTFDNNLEIEYDFVKYLNESCCNVLINISPSNIFLIVLLPARYHQNCLALLGAVSINGLKHKCCFWDSLLTLLVLPSIYCLKKYKFLGNTSLIIPKAW